MQVLKGFLKILGTLLSIGVGALLGNALGGFLRAQLTGQEDGYQPRLRHTDAEGEEYLALNLTLTHFLPAFVLGVLLKPHWLWALLSGTFMSTFIGDKSQNLGNDRLKQLVANLLPPQPEA